MYQSTVDLNYIRYSEITFGMFLTLRSEHTAILNHYLLKSTHFEVNFYKAVLKIE